MKVLVIVLVLGMFHPLFSSTRKLQVRAASGASGEHPSKSGTPKSAKHGSGKSRTTPKSKQQEFNFPDAQTQTGAERDHKTEGVNDHHIPPNSTMEIKVASDADDEDAKTSHPAKRKKEMHRKAQSFGVVKMVQMQDAQLAVETEAQSPPPARELTPGWLCEWILHFQDRSSQHDNQKFKILLASALQFFKTTFSQHDDVVQCIMHAYEHGEAIYQPIETQGAIAKLFLFFWHFILLNYYRDIIMHVQSGRPDFKSLKVYIPGATYLTRREHYMVYTIGLVASFIRKHIIEEKGALADIGFIWSELLPKTDYKTALRYISLNQEPVLIMRSKVYTPLVDFFSKRSDEYGAPENDLYEHGGYAAAQLKKLDDLYGTQSAGKNMDDSGFFTFQIPSAEKRKQSAVPVIVVLVRNHVAPASLAYLV